MTTIATWVVALFVFSIPYASGVTLATGESVARLIGFAAIAATLISTVDRGRVWLRTPNLFLLVGTVYVLWSLTTYFWSINPTSTLNRSMTNLQLIAMVWIIHQVGVSEQRRDTLAQAFVLGGYVSIAVALNVFLTAGGSAYREIGGIDPNRFATMCALAIPFAWGLAIKARTRALFWLNAMYPVAAVVGVVLAASRGGLITTLIALTVIPLTASRMSPLRRLAVIALITTSVTTIFLSAPNVFPELQRNLDRLATTADEVETGTLTGRRVIWSHGLQTFWESPIVGVGAGGFSTAIREHFGRPRGAHNGYLSVAVSVGLVGLSLFLMLFGTLVVGVLGHGYRRWEHLVMILTTGVALVHLNIEFRSVIWFVLGWVAASRPVWLTWRVACAVGDADSPRPGPPAVGPAHRT